jgi:hypothetical protein
MERTAACSCGQLSVTVEGDPAFHGLCSCFECQRESGAPFSYAGYWPKSAVRRIGGTSSEWRRLAESGRWIDRHFCPTCGSSLYGYAEFAPDTIWIAIGNFADPGFPDPRYAVWSENKDPWVVFPPSCEVRGRRSERADDA